MAIQPCLRVNIGKTKTHLLNSATKTSAQLKLQSMKCLAITMLVLPPPQRYLGQLTVNEVKTLYHRLYLDINITQ